MNPIKLAWTDVRAKAKKYPTFKVPKLKEIKALVIEKSVQILYEGERFWVRITEIDGKIFRGYVDSSLILISPEELKYNDFVEFSDKNIMNIYSLEYEKRAAKAIAEQKNLPTIDNNGDLIAFVDAKTTF